MIMNIPGKRPKMIPNIPHTSNLSLASLNLPWSMDSKTVVFNKKTITMLTTAEARRYAAKAHEPKNSKMIPKTNHRKKNTK